MKKKHIYILFGLLSLLIPAACSDDEGNTTPQETTLIDTKPIVFGDAEQGKETEIRFRAGNSWSASCLTAGWLSISPMSGNAGEACIKIKLLGNNKGATERKRDLIIQVAGEDAPYVINISQEPSAENDIRIYGDIDENVMTLQTNETGNNFIGRIKITSSKKWNIITENGANQWLSFSKDQEPQNGKETTVNLTVFASYGSFTENTMRGTFLIQAENSPEPVRIEVIAQVKCNVYENERKTDGENERTDYELVDTITSGTYQTTFYVESDIKWTLENVPEWIQVAGNESVTNMLPNGELNPMRVGIGLLLNPEYLSASSKEADLHLTNKWGGILKTIHLSFSGIGKDYLQHDFEFPASDPYGNEFSFEARAEYIDPDNSNDYWKKTEHPFFITTSKDYTNIDNAPFHLILCKGKDGVIVKEEVHWASLRMGDENQNTSNNGLYHKEVYLCANDRPDADDLNGITTQSEVREAFMFIVPNNVKFDDLFENGSSSLKAEYEDKFSRILQKQDHNADYYVTFEGLNNKDEIQIPAEGGTYTYKITSLSTLKMNYTLKRLFKPAGSEIWTEQLPTEEQLNSIYIKISDDLQSLELHVGRNTASRERRFRFYLQAFRGDNYEDINIFQFDIIQTSK